MDQPHSDSEVVADLAEEFVERHRQGERPNIEDYIRQYPQFEKEIGELFPTLLVVENLATQHDASVVGDEQETLRPIAAFESLGDYRILREVGRGGMGIVYEAEQVSLGRRVALKVLANPQLSDARHRIRFQREARSAAKLHHTNIVPVFGVGEEEGTNYYVMQLIQGLGLDETIAQLRRMRSQGQHNSESQCTDDASPPTVRDNPATIEMARSLLQGDFGQFHKQQAAENEIPQKAIDNSESTDTGESIGQLSDTLLSIAGNGSSGRHSRKPTYWDSVARIGLQVAGALQYAHDHSILHRDIKPSNLLLDNSGTVWVTDFGLAKAMDQQDLTDTGDLLGTLRYMPPEAFTSKADHRGDIYSLGITIYEMLALRPAYSESNRHRLIAQVSDGPPERLERLDATIPRDLVTIVHKAIERDPDHRYQNASEMAEDFARFVDDEPIKARRVSAVERGVRWSRRNKGMTAAMASITTLLIVGTIGALQNAKDANQARNREQELRIEADSELERARQNLYAADVGLASAAIQRKNLGAARGLLSYQAENAPDLLGIEWRLLWNQAKGDQIETLGPFPSSVCSLCPIADDLLAVGTSSHGVYLCEYPSGRILETLEMGPKIPGLNVAARNTLIYLEKANRLVHFSHTGIQMWQGPEWKTIEIPEHESNSRLYRSCTVSPSGDFVAAGYRGAISIWSAPSMEFVGEITCNSLPNSQSIVFADSDSRIAFGNRETIEVWEFQSEPFVASRKWNVNHNTSSLWSHNQWLVGASWSGDLTAWDIETVMDIETEIVVHKRPKAHETFIFGLATNSTGDVLYTGGGDQLIGRWHFPSLAPIGFTLGHGDEVWSVRSLGDQIISGGRDRTVRIFDSNPSNERPSPAGLDNVPLFTHDGRYLVGNHRSDGLTVWNTSTFQPTMNLKLEGQLVAITPSDKLRLASYEDHLKVVTVDLTSGNIESTRHFPNVTSIDLKLKWNKAGSHFAVRSDDAIEVWSVEKASMTSAFPLDRWVCAISFDGEVVATIDENDRARVNLWKHGGLEPVSIDSGTTDWIQSMAFSPDGVYFAIASHDGSLSFWNPADGSEFGRVIDSRMGPGRRIEFSPDSRTLIGWNRSHVRFWNVAIPREIMQIKLDNVNSRGTVACEFSISPDGQLMAFDRSTGDTQIWQAPNLP